MNITKHQYFSASAGGYGVHVGELTSEPLMTSDTIRGAKLSACSRSKKEPTVKVVVVSPRAEIVAVYLDGKLQPLPRD